MTRWEFFKLFYYDIVTDFFIFPERFWVDLNQHAHFQGLYCRLLNDRLTSKFDKFSKNSLWQWPVMTKLTLTSSFIWSLVAKSTDRPLLNAKLHHTILKINVKFRWSLIIHNFRQFEFPRRLTNFRNWSKNRSFFKESYHGRTYLGLQKSSWNKFFTKKTQNNRLWVENPIDPFSSPFFNLS